MRTDTGQVFRLEDYRPTDFVINRTQLCFRLDPVATRVTARVTMRHRDGAGTTLVLDGDGLTLARLTLDGEDLASERYVATPDRLEIHGLPTNRPFEIGIETIVDPTANKQLMGLYRSNGVYCTQCEAEGFRRITYFLDRPDTLSTYSVRIEARQAEAPLLLSNGNLAKSGGLADGWHFAEWEDPHPKPSYLFALVAGDLGTLRDTFVTASGRKVDLGIHVEHGKEARATYAMDALKRSMQWDEKAFGREYDLDVFNIVAVSDFNMGAMENKGLNVFNDRYVLADPETATDADYAAIEAIVAHEYFHNWTGNRITCRDWFQLCLKEGLTVYRDHEFSADQRSRPVKRVAEVRALKAHQFPEDQGPLAHPVRPRKFREINNFYTATVYEKGSEVVRMIRTILGAADFRAGMDLYFSRHDGQAVTIEDFLVCFADASGRDLSQFALWYHQAGTPTLSVTAAWSAREKSLRLDFEQSVAATPGETRKKLMHIPLAFGLVGPNGMDMEWENVEGATVTGDVIHLRKRHHSLVFTGLPARPVLSLNRGFSAPIVLHYSQSDADRTFLARHDRDAFSRWQAIWDLVTKALVAAAKAARGGKAPHFDPALVALLGEVAADATLEPAFRALALQLPGETEIAREIGNHVDPDAIHSARNALVVAVGDANASGFDALVATLHAETPFSPDAESAGRRALANVLVDYLCAAEASPKRAVTRYRSVTNMTDRAAALAIIAQRFSETREGADCLADFRRRYDGNPLVIDKWLTVEAMIPGAGALARIQRLMADPAFSLQNPNRARSLLGTFASANPTGFHRADGAAYAFFLETIMAIDAFNPQVAARLATALRSWKQLEPKRRERLRANLARAAAKSGLSSDLADILQRIVA